MNASLGPMDAYFMGVAREVSIKAVTIGDCKTLDVSFGFVPSDDCMAPIRRMEQTGAKVYGGGESNAFSLSLSGSVHDPTELANTFKAVYEGMGLQVKMGNLFVS